MLRLLVRLFRFVVLFIITFIFVMFAVENKDKVSLSLYPMPYSIDITKYAVILIALALGYLLAIWHGMLIVRRQKSITREYRTKCNSLENKLKKLESVAPTEQP